MTFQSLYNDRDIFESLDSVIDPRMEKLFESTYPYHAGLDQLLEKKDHLIDKANLTPEQKAEIKTFFTKHPNYESKIDWNNLGRLTYKDFEPIMKEAEGAKSAIKNKANTREGIESEFNLAPEGSFKVLKVGDGKIFVAPLNHEGAQFMQTAYGINAHWCIGTSNDYYWKDYVSRGGLFILCYNYDIKDKFMIHIFPDQGYSTDIFDNMVFNIEIFDTNDNSIIYFTVPSKSDASFDEEEIKYHSDAYGEPFSAKGWRFLKDKTDIDPEEMYKLIEETAELYDSQHVTDSLVEEDDVYDVLNGSAGYEAALEMYEEMGNDLLDYVMQDESFENDFIYKALRNSGITDEFAIRRLNIPNNIDARPILRNHIAEIEAEVEEEEEGSEESEE